MIGVDNNEKIFSLFLICTLAFSTLSNMIVSAESKVQVL